jgi:hypothetical protein
MNLAPSLALLAVKSSLSLKRATYLFAGIKFAAKFYFFYDF